MAFYKVILKIAILNKEVMGLSLRRVEVGVIFMEYIIFNTRLHKMLLNERRQLYLKETSHTSV